MNTLEDFFDQYPTPVYNMSEPPREQVLYMINKGGGVNDGQFGKASSITTGILSTKVPDRPATANGQSVATGAGPVDTVFTYDFTVHFPFVLKRIEFLLGIQETLLTINTVTVQFARIRGNGQQNEPFFNTPYTFGVGGGGKIFSLMDVFSINNGIYGIGDILRMTVTVNTTTIGTLQLMQVCPIANSDQIPYVKIDFLPRIQNGDFEAVNDRVV